MPRFELIEPATQDRPGLNPFTRQPIGIKGRPTVIATVDVTVEGRTFAARWLHASDTREPLGEPDLKTKAFETEEEAAAHLAEYITELRD